ncbi:MAG: PAS domain-containing sensor histidine kinase [Chloroflexales bacterium]
MYGSNHLPRANACVDQGASPLAIPHDTVNGADMAREHHLLAMLPAMCFTSRPDGLWDYVNPPFCAYTGYPAAALTGLGWAEALHADDRATSLTHWQSAIGRGTPLQVEHRLHAANGDHHWFRTHCTPHRNADGMITRWAGVATPLEITPEVAVERDLRRSAELARDSVIAIAAHELRVPMTILLGQAQLQQRRLATRAHVDPDDRYAADTLVAQALRLAQLIHALLNTAEIDHGQLSVSLTTLDLAALVRQVVQDLQPTIPTHALRVITDARPLWVAGDAMRLEQVFQNLIQNAVSYSPAGSEIVITIMAQGGHARIAVRDQGCGIAANVQPALFRRFFHVGAADARGASGLGLGLYICKAIMDLHGGSIAVESAVGAGSTVTLTLPQIPCLP